MNAKQFQRTLAEAARLIKSPLELYFTVFVP